MPCALFYQEKQASSEVYLMAASWVDGYLSAVNQYKPDTYDALSFETTELLMTILARHCQQNPQDPVFGAVNNLFEKLNDDRLTKQSEKKELIAGEHKTILYIEVLNRAQKLLAKKGFYTDKIDGELNESMKAAIKIYQQKVDLNPTGFPDQVTLWHLFRGKE